MKREPQRRSYGIASYAFRLLPDHPDRLLLEVRTRLETHSYVLTKAQALRLAADLGAQAGKLTEDRTAH